MLGTDRGDDAVVGVHEVADLLDVVDSARAHFADKDLVCGLKVLSYRPYYAECGVEVAGCDEDTVFALQKRLQVVFDARLAVASRDADDSKIGHPLEDALRVVDVVLIDKKLHRAVDEIRDEVDADLGRYEEHEYACERLHACENCSQCDDRCSEDRDGRDHSLNAGREDEFFLGVKSSHRAVDRDLEKESQPDYDVDREERKEDADDAEYGAEA